MYKLIRYKVWLNCLWLVLLVSSCSTLNLSEDPTSQQSQQNTAFAQLNDHQKVEVYQSLITAELAEKQQDYPVALSYYLYAAQLSKDPQLIEKSIRAARLARDPLALEIAAKLLLENNPQDEQSKELLMEALLEQAKYGLDSLQIAYESLVVLLKNRDHQQQFRLLKLRALNKNIRMVVSLLKQLNLQMPNNPAVISAQAELLYNLASRDPEPFKVFQQSLANIEQALVEHPYFVPAIQIKVKNLYQLKRYKDAVDFLGGLLLQKPDSSELNHMYGQLLYDLKEYNMSVAHYQSWLSEHADDLNAIYFLAASHYALEQYQLSLEYFKQLVEQDYQIDVVAFYCGQSAEQLEEFELAYNYYSQVRQGDLLAAARIRMADILADNDQVQHALSVLRDTADLNVEGQTKLLIQEIEMLKQHYSLDAAKQKLALSITEQPDNLSLLLKKIEIFELTQKPKQLYQVLLDGRRLIDSVEVVTRFDLIAAELLSEHRHYQLAKQWLDNAIEQQPENRQLLYTRALTFEKLGLYNQLISELKALLQLYPEDIDIKNALGYSLADRNQELDYAEALIDSAYASKPDSAVIIDSKGWIAYRKGQLDAAQEYLQRAYKLSPAPEIAAHLGEVLWKKSLYDKAKEIWRQALDLDKNNKVLLDTVKKFKVEL